MNRCLDETLMLFQFKKRQGRKMKRLSYTQLSYLEKQFLGNPEWTKADMMTFG